MKTLHIRFRQLNDGSFKVKYWWHFWEESHIAILDDLEDLEGFIKNLIDQTVKRWG